MRLDASSLRNKLKVFVNMAPLKPNTDSGVKKKVQSEKKSKIKHHDDTLQNLEEERAELLEKQTEGMFTSEDQERLDVIDKAISKYTIAITQANLSTGPILDSSAATEKDTVGQNVTGQAVSEQHATEHDATENKVAEQNATEQNATEQNTTANEPYPRATHANAQESPPIHRQIKREPLGDSNLSTNRLVDDLDMAWDVNVNDTHVESSLQNLSKEAFGHIMKKSQARYCVRYGSADAHSARFESALPDGSKYNETRDVTQRSNRIVERIVQIHKDKKTALPMNILSKVKILLVYWDSKVGVGHDAEVDVLAPDYPERRPHTRCFVYLDPALYADYNLDNNTGYSHETRSTMKQLMEGNDDRQKSITLHNIAVRLENKFEEKWMSGVLGRPELLRELVYERKVVPRRTRSPYTTAEPSASPILMKFEPSASATLMKPPISPRQPTPLPETRHEQAPTGTNAGMSLQQQFHIEYLELFSLAENITYTDLTKEQQILYPTQFKESNAGNS